MTFKDALYDAISQLQAVKPTPHPSAAILIYDAINILVDIQRFGFYGLLLIDTVINEAQEVAKDFTDRWERNMILKSQKAEVYTMGSPARFFWRTTLSRLAGNGAFSHYSADEILISITPHNGHPINYRWDQVTQACADFSPIVFTPPASSPEGSIQA